MLKLYSYCLCALLFEHWYGLVIFHIHNMLYFVSYCRFS